MSLNNFFRKHSSRAILCKQEFLSSGTFIMPAGVLNNQILVATTGSGGAGLLVKHISHKDGHIFVGRGGGGSGVQYSTLFMNQDAEATVLVGGSVHSVFLFQHKYPIRLSSSAGCSSSFTGTAPCPGGAGVTICKDKLFGDAIITGGEGSAGGGNGKDASNEGTEFRSIFQCTGGDGFYNKAEFCTDALPNSGAGAGEMSTHELLSSGSGRVIVYYYKSSKEQITHGDPTTDVQYAIIKNNIVDNIIVAPRTWTGVGINISNREAKVEYSHISDNDLKFAQYRCRPVGLGDTYNPITDTFISSSEIIEWRWEKEKIRYRMYLLNQ